MERNLVEGASPRKRKSRGFITQNACTECRRKRAKCDGLNPCSNCAARKLLECKYEIPTRVSKEHMRKEIEHLQFRLQARETVINALGMDESSGLVLQQLRDKIPVEEIADHVYKSFPLLRSRQHLSREETLSSETDYGSYESHASGSWNPYRTYERSTNQPWKEASYSTDPQRLVEEESFDQTLEVVAMEWTEVSSDKDMIENMFALYFSWEYPIFQTLSKEPFLSDFRAGTNRYCSSLLVNALLALGCRLSVQQDSQAVPGEEGLIASRFFAESKRILALKSPPMLSIVQALGLMSLYEASCGNDSESWFFSSQSIQVAIEMGLHVEIPVYDQVTAIEQEVRNVTFWGAFLLHQTWSLTLGRLPITSKNASRVAKYPSNLTETIESSPSVPYKEERMAREDSVGVSSHIQSTHRCFCELSEIINYSLNALNAPGGNLSSIDLLDIYTRYLAWKDSLPEKCQLNATPISAVLFLHIYYHFTLIMLFRPFINLRFIRSAISPLEVCVQAANNICSLIQTYKKTFSLQQTPVFVPYMLLASAIVHLVRLRSAPAQIGGSLSILPEMEELQLLSFRSPFSRRSISIIKYLARQWAVGVFVGQSTIQPDSQDDTCLPVPGTMNFFCPNPKETDAISHENPDAALFGPFPMQGLPLIAGLLVGMERI